MGRQILLNSGIVRLRSKMIEKPEVAWKSPSSLPFFLSSNVKRKR
jgi:uncharacterized Rmd1/YagE family protein